MDDELAAIRARRLADLQQQQQSSTASAGGSAGNDEEAASAAAAAQQEDEARRTILSQILSPEARERLSRIRLVKPERANKIEGLLINTARSGQLRGRVSEEQLINVLDQVEAAEKGTSGRSESAGKITFSRRKVVDDDDDFDL